MALLPCIRPFHPVSLPQLLPQTPRLATALSVQPVSTLPGLGSSCSELTDLVVTVPGTSQTLKPAHCQASRSHIDTSPASDDRGNAARIAALEEKQSALERQMLEFDVRLKKLGA